LCVVVFGGLGVIVGLGLVIEGVGEGETEKEIA
jgi:hypothetical protein